jgi:tetratricopeptide (TPR) repeat protein
LVKTRRVVKKSFEAKPELPVPYYFTFADFCRRNQSQILIGVVAVVLVAAGALVWKYMARQSEEKAADLLYEASKVYKKAIDEEKPLDESLKLFQALVNQYAGTGAGKLGAFYLGNCQYASKKYDEAITTYTGFLGRVAAESPMALSAYDSLGYCYEAKGDFKKAVECFEKTVNPAPGLGEDGYLNIARCYESLDDRVNSRKAYEKFLVHFPDAQRAGLVRAKLKLLPVATPESK